MTVEDGNIRDIQEIFLKLLDIRAREQNKDQRTRLISEDLKNKRYVLFLDEVALEINLKEIGIHDKHRNGKMIFASGTKTFVRRRIRILMCIDSLIKMLKSCYVKYWVNI